MVSSPSSSLALSDELILKIFEYLTDTELLSLAAVSKHFHDVALMTHLGRYGITETNIEANSFEITSGAIRAFHVARFVTRIDALRLRFESNNDLDRDVAALASLVRELPPIKSIDLEFSPSISMGEWCNIEGLVLDLISANSSRTSITISPMTVSIARPRKPALYAVRKLIGRLCTVGSAPYLPTELKIGEAQLREALKIVSLLRLGGQPPSVSIRALDPAAPVGSLIVLRAVTISSLHLTPELGLSSAETSVLLAHLNLPLLRTVDVTACAVSEPALHSFLCRHPTLYGIRLRSRRAKKHSPQTSLPALLSLDALPQLDHVFASARLLAWVLASPQPSPHLVAVTIELHVYKTPSAELRESYCAALRGLARRPTADTLVLQLAGWAPWDAPDFTATTAPERALSHVVDLRLTFLYPSRLPRGKVLVEWVRLFGGLQTVSLFDTRPLEGLCVLLRKEFPHISITSGYTRGRLVF
ncbi:hypothetical protein B0H12DRAFT_1153268 [Mycena haematopus]|nr:hypothetical protein B0H12DRAFT_1153268 [Mycena haematopus]